MATMEEINQGLREGSDWVVCLNCLHVRHTRLPMIEIDEPCPQCGVTGTVKRVTIPEVTHCLRRQLPRSIKQYTMKAKGKTSARKTV